VWQDDPAAVLGKCLDNLGVDAQSSSIIHKAVFPYLGTMTALVMSAGDQGMFVSFRCGVSRRQQQQQRGKSSWGAVLPGRQSVAAPPAHAQRAPGITSPTLRDAAHHPRHPIRHHTQGPRRRAHRRRLPAHRAAGPQVWCGAGPRPAPAHRVLARLGVCGAARAGGDKEPTGQGACASG
jgi:hypothetical protein